MAQNATIEARVKDLLRAQLGAAEVLRESALVTDLGADSLDLVEIELAICDDFGIDCDGESEKWRIAGDVIDFVEANAK